MRILPGMKLPHFLKMPDLNFNFKLYKMSSILTKISNKIRSLVIQRIGGGLPEALEELFLNDLKLDGQTIYDVGGNVGLFTIFFARKAGSRGNVIVFEPLSENCDKISEAIKLNNITNIRIITLGLGKTHEIKSIAVRLQETGTASMEEHIKALILAEENSRVLNAEIDTLDHQIVLKQLPKPNFIKIDVEGMEMDVLLGMTETIRNHKPQLFIEVHGASMQRKIENARNIVNFLLEKGYSLYHIESNNKIDRANYHLTREGHLYCF